MPADWMPKDGQSLCEWAENFKLEFPMVASSLTFAAPEITAVLADCNYLLFVCRSAKDASSFANAWIQSRDVLLHGDANTSFTGFPNTTMPAQPAAPVVLPGILTRFRATVKRIKGCPTCTPAVKQTLRIVGNVTPLDPATAKPKPRVKPLPMFEAELKWRRLGFSGVIVRSQRDGETDWTDHGIKTGTSFADDRPPVAANKPEYRRYQMIYVQNDVPVGQWSDVVGVTLQP